MDVVVPGAPAIANAADAAAADRQLRLADQLNDSSTALTNLLQNPNSAVYLVSHGRDHSIVSQG